MIPGADVLDACRPPAKTPAELQMMRERNALAAGTHPAPIAKLPTIPMSPLDEIDHGGWNFDGIYGDMF